MSLRDEGTRLLDAQYAPKIQAAIADGCYTVRAIADRLDMDQTGLFRMMRRLGYKKAQGWKRGKGK